MLRHEQNSYILRGHIFTVRNQLGLGWSESVYHNALLKLFDSSSIPHLSKPRRTLTHRGVELHLFEPDIIVWNQIVLELKVLPGAQDFLSEMYAQLIHYLKFFKFDVGFLVNFAGSPIVIKRIVWDEAKFDIYEDVSLLNLLELNSLPASLTTLRQLSLIPTWNDQMLGKQSIAHLLINTECLLFVRSLVRRPSSYNFAITRTYMKNLGIKFALIVNFGQGQLQLFATHL